MPPVLLASKDVAVGETEHHSKLYLCIKKTTNRYRKGASFLWNAGSVPAMKQLLRVSYDNDKLIPDKALRKPLKEMMLGGLRLL